MKMKSVVLLFSVLVWSGCTSDDFEEIEVPFSVEFKGAQVRCGRGVTVGANSKAHLWLADLKFLVSRVETRLSNGQWGPVELVPDGEFQTRRNALLDFEDATGECAKEGTAFTRLKIRLRVPKNGLGGLRFVLGGARGEKAFPGGFGDLMPKDTGSYSFLRLVMRDDFDKTLSIDLRSTGCEKMSSNGKECVRENRALVEFEKLLLKEEGVVLDIGDFLARLDTSGKPVLIRCSGEPDSDQCGTVFSALGLDLVSGKPRGNQVAFRSKYLSF